MKLLFSGPTLASDRIRMSAEQPDIVFAGPAGRGDIFEAAVAGANAIGLIDGVFGDRPSVWHKEILFALSQGVAVAGGASLGAMRAVECAPFGMVGLGRICRLFAEGLETDDACVAQIHAPEEFGWTPLSKAAVDVEGTLDAAAQRGVLSEDERVALGAANRDLFYAERSYPRIVAAAGIAGPRGRDLVRELEALPVAAKRADALLVLEWLVARPDRRSPPPTDWTFHPTSQWQALMRELEARRSKARPAAVSAWR